MRMRFRAESGLTLIEMVVTTAVVAITGMVIFLVLNSGLILYSKNIALNTAHQQARVALLQIEQELHSANSLPYLVDASLVPVVGQGPAAGISFQIFAGNIGQCRVNANAAASQNVVQILVPSGVAPVATQRLIVPTHQIEMDIVSVTSAGTGIYNLTLASNLPTAITVKKGASLYNTVCFITDRISYVVVNGELKYYGPSVRRSFSVMGNNITSPTPFSTPNTVAGAPYYRFVVAVNLSTSDPAYVNRNFKGANILLNGLVPMRARLTTYN